MATHSNIDWKIPWAEKPGRLQSMGSQRAVHDQACMHTCACKEILGYYADVKKQALHRKMFMAFVGLWYSQDETIR